MRRTMVLVLLLIVGAFAAGTAAAATPRQAATDQYGTPPPIGTPTTPVSTPTTPTTPTPDNGGNGDSTTDSGGNAPESDSGSGAGNGTSPGSGSSPGSASGSGAAGAGSSAGTGPPANRVAVIDFGLAPKKLRNDIRESLESAGLQVLFSGKLSKARFKTFLASPFLEQLSKDGPGPAGQAFGAQLVDVTPLARQVFPVVFGTRQTFDPVIRAVLTRRSTINDDQEKFAEGVAKGLLSTDVPLAYVERSDAKKSFIDDFKDLKVLTVDDIDKPAGKLRLAQIMLGQITTQKAVDAIKVDPAASVTTDTDGSTGATPWILLAVVLGGVAFMATGTLRRRRGGTIA